MAPMLAPSMLISTTGSGMLGLTMGRSDYFKIINLMGACNLTTW
nr:MAG TPA: hypothetical protein [Caudoviricetes sp.]